MRTGLGPSAYTRGEENPLRPLPVQYADFALWQRSWMDEGGLAHGLTYWLNELRERGLVFTEGGRWVSLATTSTSTSTTAAAVSEPLAALAAAGA